ncbi:MAG: HAD family hydrolase [Chloroflexi bacterium]|nr:HAD family hydrolase [Chloroflexota bacterium]
MGKVIIHKRKFDVDCIIFDKDDTLIEFNPIWGGRTQKWVEAMVASSGLTDAIKRDLFSILGYSVELASARAEGPLAIASIETLCTLATGTLCQHGIPWHEAQNHAKSSAQDTILAAFDPSEIHPRGDIAKVMHQLARAQINIAVVTSDDRQMTEDTLAFLGVSDLVNIVICGDDPIPNKPAPDALWLVSAQLGIETNRIMMVGDTKSDMQFALNGGAAFRIAITPTIENKNASTLPADAVISSIDDLRVVLH